MTACEDCRRLDTLATEVRDIVRNAEADGRRDDPHIVRLQDQLHQTLAGHERLHRKQAELHRLEDKQVDLEVALDEFNERLDAAMAQHGYAPVMFTPSVVSGFVNDWADHHGDLPTPTDLVLFLADCGHCPDEVALHDARHAFRRGDITVHDDRVLVVRP